MAKKKKKAAKPKSKSTIGKIASGVGKVAELASNFIPGGSLVSGALKGIGSLFNSPEWWERYGATGLTTNLPLRVVDQEVGASGMGEGRVVTSLDRPFLLETISSCVLQVTDGDTIEGFLSAVDIPNEYVTSFIIPTVRHVLNAVSLQKTASYTEALMAAATLAAIKYNLRKIENYVKLQQPISPPFLARCPISSPANYAQLQGLMNRIDTTLKTRVRLPDIMHEVLQWRYGRVYKSNASEKSAVVMYNLLPLASDFDAWSILVSKIEAVLATNTQALADLFNAFATHKQDHEMQEGSELHYDLEEFVLRCNMQQYSSVASSVQDPDVFVMDSALENRSVFTATSVSSPIAVKNLGSEPNKVLQKSLNSSGNVDATYAFVKPTHTTLFPVLDSLVWSFVPGERMPKVTDDYLNSYTSGFEDWTVAASGPNTPLTGSFQLLLPTTEPGCIPALKVLGSAVAYILRLIGKGNPWTCIQCLFNWIGPGVTWAMVVYASDSKDVTPPPSNQVAGLRIHDTAFNNTTPSADVNHSYFCNRSVNAGAYVAVSHAVTVTLTPIITVNTTQKTNAANNVNWLEIATNNKIWAPEAAVLLHEHGLAKFKAVDLYESNINLSTQFQLERTNGTTDSSYYIEDATSISMDAGLVPGSVIYTTQRAAFANLTNSEYKTPAIRLSKAREEMITGIEDVHEIVVNS